MVRPTTLLYFNVGHYGGTWRAKCLVLGIKNVITTDGKRPTISSDANY